MAVHLSVGNSIQLSLYALVGNRASDGFVRHAAIAARSGVHQCNRVEVCHMGPPLESAGCMRGDIVGTIELTGPEIDIIEQFTRRNVGEHAAFLLDKENAHEAYCIHPHRAPFREADGRYARTRFSCVGFVYASYRKASIEILDETQLPTLLLSQLKRSYPQHSKKLDDPKFRAAMGLHGEGPWPVMLCGYLFHSLNRPDSEIRSIPYQPSESDAWFS